MSLKSKRAINIIFLLIGLSALFLLIKETGVKRLFSQLLFFGKAFPLILLVEALSNFFSNFGWYYSFNPKERPSFTKLLLIIFASLSVSGSLPTGQAGEVVKGNLLRGIVNFEETLSSLIIYNYLHVLTTLFLVLCGPLISLFFPYFSLKINLLSLGISLILFLLVCGIGILLHLGVIHWFMKGVEKVSKRFIRISEKVVKSSEELSSKVHALYCERNTDLIRCSIYLIIGRIFAVVEVYIILRYLGISNSIVVSLLVYCLTAIANYLLMVLPAREGFLEGSSYFIFKMIGMNAADGLSMEIVRRLRKIFYQIIGIFILIVFSQKKEKME